MKKKIVSVFFVLFFCILSVNAQKKLTGCTLTNDIGVTLEGYLKHFDPWLHNFGKYFRIYDSKGDKFIKIVSSMWVTIDIDTVRYESLINKDGRPSFMKLEDPGPKVSLYIDIEEGSTYSAGMGSIPWSRNYCYIKSDSDFYYIDPRILHRSPRNYLPNCDQDLVDEIMSTKIRNTPMNIPKWVVRYNKQ